MKKIEIILVSAATLILGSILHAGDVRVWSTRKGTTHEAELLKVDAVNATLVGKDAKQMVIKIEDLSLGDRQYIVETGGGDPKLLIAGTVGIPEKEVKIDTSTFNKKTDETIAFGDSSLTVFKILKSEHFVIAYSGNVRPAAFAETAERMWHGMAFQHMNFRRDWTAKKMLLVPIEDRKAHAAFGKWYTNYLKNAGDEEAAGKTAASWDQTGLMGISVPPEIASEHNILERGLLFNIQPDNASLYDKPLSSSLVHVLAKNLLTKQMGGVSSVNPDGSFAVLTGHGYYKEILITGESKTSLLSVTGSDTDKVGVAKGFSDGASWAKELKSLVRKGTVKLEMEKMFKMTMEHASPENLAMAYSFAYYMQSTPRRLASFDAMLRRAEANHQIPVPAEMARIFGFNSVAEMDADWTLFVKEGNFK